MAKLTTGFLYKAGAPGFSWSSSAGRLRWKWIYLQLQSIRGQAASLAGSLLLACTILSEHQLKCHWQGYESYLKPGQGISSCSITNIHLVKFNCKICTLNEYILRYIFRLILLRKSLPYSLKEADAFISCISWWCLFVHIAFSDSAISP